MSYEISFLDLAHFLVKADDFGARTLPDSLRFDRIGPSSKIIVGTPFKTMYPFQVWKVC